MSTKKRFSISADLASGIRNTIESVAQHEPDLRYDMMPLELIEPDPQNPRKLSVKLADVLQFAVEPTGFKDFQLKDLEGLQEVATSIKRVGIRNAIEVYKEGAKYRIISGERRYLGSYLAGLKAVPVRISPKPEKYIYLNKLQLLNLLNYLNKLNAL